MYIALEADIRRIEFMLPPLFKLLQVLDARTSGLDVGSRPLWIGGG